MARRTIDYLLREIEVLATSTQDTGEIIQKVMESLRRFRILRELERPISDAEWQGILLSARDLMNMRMPYGHIVNEVITREIGMADAG
ncbi:hypothetical protein GCM10019059_08340 [Camelimonas fluminis]|uniref:Uncharacterized protein n=1 Tax=Camelimonas fluminis TaxID=1576911 RepID=A0ABV7UEX7_9HYPH|nr:hypothetical protein [Camelimonas fluminis]GHE51403.1 hypothetical protein GCM10019059_08340 [Camelimonas fluminis]